MRRTVASSLLALLLLASLGVAQAVPFGEPVFRSRWERADLPVEQRIAMRSWTWGPEPFTPLLREPYADSPTAQRTVQYLDKSRMEIIDPNIPATQPWYVTNGLLVVEMIEGKIQVGDSQFAPKGEFGANVPVAGDPDNEFPTYASLIRIYRTPRMDRLGQHVTAVFLREGANEFPQYASDPATEIVHVERDFGVPRAFWNFMNQRGVVYQNGRFVQNQPVFDWLFVMGYPITDAFWTRVRVGNVERDVMFQAFERRVLTYTPGNPDPWKVEMGNVGQQYYRWRYEQ